MKRDDLKTGAIEHSCLARHCVVDKVAFRRRHTGRINGRPSQVLLLDKVDRKRSSWRCRTTSKGRWRRRRSRRKRKRRMVSRPQFAVTHTSEWSTSTAKTLTCWNQIHKKAKWKRGTSRDVLRRRSRCSWWTVCGAMQGRDWVCRRGRPQIVPTHWKVTRRRMRRRNVSIWKNQRNRQWKKDSVSKERWAKLV